ncbi:MAG: CtsR family transcriptional regulator [Oscillospiraceae bacterium]|nr:CtsR family transcriptional regulator [Oscillospiraceae bacterium]
MKISEMIAREILSLLDEQDGIAEIKRNDFANKLGCVPSQINYVLTSRFSASQGFIVESRRGGGGYIKITRVSDDKKAQIMHIVQSLGSELELNEARSILINLCYQEYIDSKTAGLILSCISDTALKGVDPAKRNNVRADIFKNALVMAL